MRPTIARSPDNNPLAIDAYRRPRSPRLRFAPSLAGCRFCETTPGAIYRPLVLEPFDGSSGLHEQPAIQGRCMVSPPWNKPRRLNGDATAENDRQVYLGTVEITSTTTTRRDSEITWLHHGIHYGPVHHRCNAMKKPPAVTTCLLMGGLLALWGCRMQSLRKNGLWWGTRTASVQTCRRGYRRGWIRALTPPFAKYNVVSAPDWTSSPVQDEHRRFRMDNAVSP